MKLQVAWLSALVGLASATAAGCGKPLPAGLKAGRSGTFSFNTTDPKYTQRTYILHLPSKYDANKPSPVIFSYHGLTRTAASQEALSQFDNGAWNPDGIVVYPQGINVRIFFFFFFFVDR